MRGHHEAADDTHLHDQHAGGRHPGEDADRDRADPALIGAYLGALFSLSGRTALVTGGSSGIGLAMAEAFAEAGSTVLICGRSEKRLKEAGARHPDFHVRVCDVGQAEDRQTLLAWVQDRFPALNVLVNNAGVQRDIDLSHGLGEFLAGENEI
ncbi:MAG TPA: SDR family NAD(P)-dependent oxidoreductase, partial [Rugosimonospora sp.]|nr:SDR family NAD(P)-dependent oxidoreductase [Rugosimonospora sp.]